MYLKPSGDFTGKPPSVSVVVISYNSSEYLSDCLNSLIGQSYSLARIIVCDDASSDGSKELINDYSKKFPGLIDPVIHPANLGVSKNLNSGLKRVRTDYYSLIAGDDCWEKEKIELEIQKAVQENCDVVYSDSALIDVNGNFLEPFKRKFDGSEGNILFEMLTHQMTMRNPLVKTSLLEKTGLYDESFHMFEDWEFKIRLGRIAKVGHVKRETVFYRQHKKGLSKSAPTVFFENLAKVYLKHDQVIKGLEKKQRNRILSVRDHDLYQPLSKAYTQLGFSGQILKMLLLVLKLDLKLFVRFFYQLIRNKANY